MAFRIFIFLIINFAALAIGGLSTNKAVSSDWYLQLNKAPWTPPGWVFGAAWTTIMICFSFYMAFAWKSVSNHKFLLSLFIIQWVLNVIWNPIFFSFNHTILGLVVITALASLVILIAVQNFKWVKYYSILIVPYIIWMIIATSLNLYVVLNN